MAMITDLMETFHHMNKAVVDDPVGGTKETYTKGASFDAYALKNNSTEAIVAEKQMGTEFFTVVTKKSTMLVYNDVIRRASDGKLFIVKSKGKDSEAPARSTVQIRKVVAEDWIVPSGVVILDESSGGST